MDDDNSVCVADLLSPPAGKFEVEYGSGNTPPSPSPLNIPAAPQWKLAAPRDPSPHGKRSNFWRIARNLRRAVMDFGVTSYDSEGKKSVVVTDSVIYNGAPSFEEATGFSSEVKTMPGMHKVVLDIDMEAILVPSTTPGHYHLIIEKYMEEETYFQFLQDMAKYGIIQEGYATHSIRRGASWIRAPWFRKGQKATPQKKESSDDV